MGDWTDREVFGRTAQRAAWPPLVFTSAAGAETAARISALAAIRRGASAPERTEAWLHAGVYWLIAASRGENETAPATMRSSRRGPLVHRLTNARWALSEVRGGTVEGQPARDLAWDVAAVFTQGVDGLLSRRPLVRALLARADAWDSTMIGREVPDLLRTPAQRDTDTTMQTLPSRLRPTSGAPEPAPTYQSAREACWRDDLTDGGARALEAALVLTPLQWSADPEIARRAVLLEAHYVTLAAARITNGPPLVFETLRDGIAGLAAHAQGLATAALGPGACDPGVRVEADQLSRTLTGVHHAVTAAKTHADLRRLAELPLTGERVLPLAAMTQVDAHARAGRIVGPFARADHRHLTDGGLTG